jgi:hypothetical protein
MTSLILAIALMLQSATPAQTATIEGIVVRADSRQPLAGAQVTLVSLNSVAPGVPFPPTVSPPPAGLARIPAITTDNEGRFSFKGLTAGIYRVRGAAGGFLNQEYGQRSPYGVGEILFLSAGQTAKDIGIRLPQAATVTGRVTDQNGVPAVGAPVQILRSVYNAQLLRDLQSVGTARTNDRGEFRLFDIKPGRYYLAAGSLQTFYPNAQTVEQASVIEVKAGIESSFDIRMPRQDQTYSVRGRVVDSTGIALPSGLMAILPNGALIVGRVDPETGAFEFLNVAPGEYTVQTRLALPNPQAAGGSAAVSRIAATRPEGEVLLKLVDSNIEGLVLQLKHPVSTSGRIVVEDQATPSPRELEGVRFALALATTSGAVNLRLPVVSGPAADGTFQIDGLREADYRVQVSGVPAGFYVKSVRFGSKDILPRFNFNGTDIETVEVMLRRGTAQIRGTVTDAQSQPARGKHVILVPADRTRSDLYRPVGTDHEGRFSIANVSPGEYKVFSWEALDLGAYYDPDFLKEHEEQGKTALVAESSNQTVDLKLIPAR